MNKNDICKKLGFVLSLVLLGTMFSGCQPSQKEIVNPVQPSSETVFEKNTEKDLSSKSVLKEETGPKAPLTGEVIKEKKVLDRPIVVMLDNHVGARPQAGLSHADHIYEILAEGRITRYMAVFHSQVPETIGPIRSARPYFIDKALEYKPYYVHVGGSMAAQTDIIQLKMGDVDGLSSGGDIFWRKKHKKIPHNMYSTIEAIQKEAHRRGHKKEVDVTPWIFLNKKQKEVGEDTSFVKFVYKPPGKNDKIGYSVSYHFDKKEGRYARFVNGKRHVDESQEKPLWADNVVVQIAQHKVIDNEGRRKISFVGSGKGYLYSRGEKQPITWDKADRRKMTIFRDDKGEELSFATGNIWFQVIEKEEQIHEQKK